jgi:hypothetical protein
MACGVRRIGDDDAIGRKEKTNAFVQDGGGTAG